MVPPTMEVVAAAQPQDTHKGCLYHGTTASGHTIPSPTNGEAARTMVETGASPCLVKLQLMEPYRSVGERGIYAEC